MDNNNITVDRRICIKSKIGHAFKHNGNIYNITINEPPTFHTKEAFNAWASELEAFVAVINEYRNQ